LCGSEKKQRLFPYTAERQTDKAWEPSKMECCFVKRETVERKSTFGLVSL